jgi:hypothetical protein
MLSHRALDRDLSHRLDAGIAHLSILLPTAPPLVAGDFVL